MMIRELWLVRFRTERSRRVCITRVGRKSTFALFFTRSHFSREQELIKFFVVTYSDVTCLIGVVGELEASPNRRDVA